MGTLDATCVKSIRLMMQFRVQAVVNKIADTFCTVHTHPHNLYIQTIIWYQ